MQAQTNNQKSEHVESRKPRPEAVLDDRRPVQSRLERQEARPEAVLGAKRPVWRPSWALRGPSRGHLERQETGPEAVLSARRAVQGCLGRQEARLQAVLAVRRPECRFYCSFATKCRFCAGRSRPPPAPKFQSRKAANAPLQNFLFFLEFVSN